MATIRTIATGKTVEYASAIPPIKDGDKFKPNYEALKKHKGPTMFMYQTDFERNQRDGKTILINNMGGWCFLTSKEEIVAE